MSNRHIKKNVPKYMLPYRIQGYGILMLWSHVWVPVMILGIVFALLKWWKRSLSWGWLIDTGVVLICCFLCLHLSFKEMGVSPFIDTEKHQKFIALLDATHNAPIMIPNEQMFKGMKKYEIGQYKYSETENTYVDNDNQPITGVIYKGGEMGNNGVILPVKDGKNHGWGVWYSDQNGKKNKIAAIKTENGRIKETKFFNPDGQLYSETIISDDYIQGRQFYKTGELMSETINDRGMGIIIRTFDKTGRRNIEIDMISMSMTCQLPDGRMRILTSSEVENFFKETDKAIDSATQGPSGYEPNVLCH